MMRTALAGLGAIAATVLAVGIAAPAQAASKSVTLTNPSGGTHAVLSWDDTYDTLCLTLKSTAASAYADADMSLTDGTHFHHLRVTRSNTRDCTGNLSIPEDRAARMSVNGGTNSFHKTSGWVGFYT